MTASDQHAREAAEHVRTTLTGVFDWLDDLSGKLLHLHTAVTERHRALCLDDLGELQKPIFGRLRAESELLAGTGVILAENVLGDRSHWLEWWQHRPDAPPKFLQVNHDPSSVEFYEFTEAEWFKRPREQHHRVLTGPYVDYCGTDEYLLTLSVPVLADDKFLGVAAADIHVAAFEKLLLRSRGPADPPTALVNRTERIVAASAPNHVTGTLLRGHEHHLRSTVDIEGTEGLPWQIVVLTTTG